MPKYTLALLFFTLTGNSSFAFAGFLTDKLNKAKIELTCSNLKIIQTSLDLYKLDHFKYPSTDEGLAILVETHVIKESQFLNDPWGTPYEYKNIDMDISLKSLGPNKKEGDIDDVSLISCESQ